MIPSAFQECHAKIHKLLYGHAQISQTPDLPEEGFVALWIHLKDRRSEALPHPADPESGATEMN